MKKEYESETKKFFQDVNPIVQKYIDKIINPVFDKVLQEKTSNHMLVGKNPKKEPTLTYLNLHNYRRYFDFDKSSYLPPNLPQKIKEVGYKPINYSSEHIYSNYYNHQVRIKKTQIQITCKINNWETIKNYESKKEIRKIVIAKEENIIWLLNKFIQEFGGSTNYEFKNQFQEIKITHNAITDKLRKKHNWHKKDHKKVYKDKVIELYDINKAIQLIDNSIFYDNNKEIAEPMRVLAEGIGQLLPVTFKNYEWLKDNIKTIEEGKMYKKDIENLEEQQRWNLAQELKKRIFSATT